MDKVDFQKLYGRVVVEAVANSCGRSLPGGVEYASLVGTEYKQLKVLEDLGLIRILGIEPSGVAIRFPNKDATRNFQKIKRMAS